MSSAGQRDEESNLKSGLGKNEKLEEKRAEMKMGVNLIRVLKASVQRCLSGKPLYDFKC